VTDHEIAKHLDSKQYGTIHTPEQGREALHLMLIELGHLGRNWRESAPQVLDLAVRITKDVVRRPLKEMEMAVAELDHDGYPETAREFADVLKQMRSLERR
jgi:hypothetical protein